MQRIQTRKRLAELYNADRETITRWLNKIGITHSCSLTPIELEMFVQKIGTPEQIKQSAKLLGIG
jgi:abortive infection bacteriophage resistance protein